MHAQGRKGYKLKCVCADVLDQGVEYRRCEFLQNGQNQPHSSRSLRNGLLGIAPMRCAGCHKAEGSDEKINLDYPLVESQEPSETRSGPRRPMLSSAKCLPERRSRVGIGSAVPGPSSLNLDHLDRIPPLRDLTRHFCRTHNLSSPISRRGHDMDRLSAASLDLTLCLSRVTQTDCHFLIACLVNPLWWSTGRTIPTAQVS